MSAFYNSLDFALSAEVEGNGLIESSCTKEGLRPHVKFTLTCCKLYNDLSARTG